MLLTVFLWFVAGRPIDRPAGEFLNKGLFHEDLLGGDSAIRENGLDDIHSFLKTLLLHTLENIFSFFLILFDF